MPTGQLQPRLQQALELTFQLHGRDARKGSQVPVMAHLLGVCALVQQDGGNEDEAIAALLHDCLEDKPEQISRQEIRARFGAQVLQLVVVATDTPADYRGGRKPPWLKRKQRYLRAIEQADPSLLRVTIADKIDNLRAIIADYERLGEALWDRFSAGRDLQRWYFSSSYKAFQKAGYSGKLLDEMGRLLQILERLIAAAAT